jgi:hypothetical protein
MIKGLLNETGDQPNIRRTKFHLQCKGTIVQFRELNIREVVHFSNHQDAKEHVKTLGHMKTPILFSSVYVHLECTHYQ